MRRPELKEQPVPAPTELRLQEWPGSRHERVPVRPGLLPVSVLREPERMLRDSEPGRRVPSQAPEPSAER